MSRFEFELDALLRVRKVEEDRKVRALQAIENQLVELRHEVLRVNEAKQVGLESMSTKTEGDLDIDALAGHRRHLNTLDREEREILVRIEPVLEAAAAARIELARAIDERKAVEKLRDKKKRAFLVDQARKEIRELDETGRVSAAARERVQS